MKPRLKQGWENVFCGGLIPIHGWFCEGNGITAFSISPKAAFARWEALVIAGEIDELLTTPRPTFWQRLKKAWNEPGWDVSARVF